jgi:hypothetical protein
MNVSVSRTRTGRVANYTIPHRGPEVAARKSVRLRVAVRAEKPQILQAVVGRIPVDVVNLEDQVHPVPLGAKSAKPAKVREQICVEDITLESFSADTTRALTEHPSHRCCSILGTGSAIWTPVATGKRDPVEPGRLVKPGKRAATQAKPIKYLQ